ncbi:MAG: inositol monophosphatase [Bacteroidales bacterium]|nr:inositol monophosphatase [Bacteroidales bacterium]
MPDYKQICKEVCLLAMSVGDYQKSERQKIERPSTETKGVHDYVTQFDKESERRIVGRLRELLPGSGFIAEEGTATGEGDGVYRWIVDPLDGTTNYIHGLRCSCVSIALQEHDEIVVGVVYEIWAGECFYAYKGGNGAYLNGTPIKTSATIKLDDALIATGFPYTNFDRIIQYMRLLRWTMESTHGVRRMGSAAADLAYVACGRFDGFYEYGLKPYDVAAGAFIVQQAGGKVSDFSGGSNWLFGGEITANCAGMHSEFVSILRKYMSHPLGNLKKRLKFKK